MLKMLSRDSVRLSAQTRNEKLVPINSVQLSPHGEKKKILRNCSSKFAILPSSTTASVKILRV